jgi:hypothetical protein
VAAEEEAGHHTTLASIELVGFRHC